MTGTLMRRWRAEFLRRPLRPLAPLALLALAPKCVVCLLAYAGLGAALGLRTPEICGAAAGGRGSWALSVAGAGGALATARFIARYRRLRLPRLHPLPGRGLRSAQD
jgi:hypothetical protein